VVSAVVKFGGGLLRREGAFERVAEALAACGGGRPFLVVPGGGPFAETVRDQGRQLRIDAGTAHWMAILGMDQYAHALASRIRRAALVVGNRTLLERSPPAGSRSWPPTTGSGPPTRCRIPGT